MDRYSYQMYELLHLAFAPARAASEAALQLLTAVPPLGEHLAGPQSVGFRGTLRAHDAALREADLWPALGQD